MTDTQGEPVPAEGNDDRSDADLVRDAGFQSLPGHSAERVAAHRAAAELTRRLSSQIADLRDELSASGRTLNRLTLTLVILTLVLVVLTVILLTSGA